MLVLTLLLAPPSMASLAPPWHAATTPAISVSPTTCLQRDALRIMLAFRCGQRYSARCLVRGDSNDARDRREIADSTPHRAGSWGVSNNSAQHCGTPKCPLPCACAKS